VSYDAVAVANYLVSRDLAEHDRKPTLTNMALQKILYFAEGRYLAGHDQPLFENPIEAWDYGPVVPDVYHAFKSYGSKPITAPAKTLVADDHLRAWRWSTPEVPPTPDTAADRAFLDQIWADYGSRSAVNLMAESHRQDGPWAQLYRPDRRHVEIPVEMMRAYFATYAS
jgi:uncharacterized phage-associated protein